MAKERPIPDPESLRRLRPSDPSFSNGGGRGGSTVDAAQRRFAPAMDEAFDQLWVRIQRRLAGALRDHSNDVDEEEIRHHSIQSLLLTSWTEKEGSTTVALGLAARAAMVGIGKICLVDADFYSSGLTGMASKQNAAGLADWLSGGNSLDDVLIRLPENNLWFLPSGRVEGRDAVVTDAKVQEAIGSLEDRFRYVFYDTSSLKHGVDAFRWGRFVRNTILVVRAGLARRQTVAQSVSAMRLQGLRVLGTVLNQRVDPIPSWLYPYL